MTASSPEAVLSAVASPETGVLSAAASLLEAAENTDLIFTGIRLYPEMLEWADEVYEISVLKESE